jgi:hypothetical protein
MCGIYWVGPTRAVSRLQIPPWKSKLWSSGNPNNSLEVYNFTVAYTKSLNGYRPQGNIPLIQN